MNLTGLRCLAVLAAMSVSFGSGTALAQVLYGSIVGSVRDASDAAVPSAAVRITNTATNQSRESTANGSGEFAFPSLEPGTYDVTASAPGFQTFTAKGVRAGVDETARVSAVLKVGAVTESVVVSANAVTLQTDSA